MQTKHHAKPRLWQRALVIAAIVCAIGSVAMAFWSGCIADLKGGSWGNPHEALRIESLGLPLDLLAVLFTCLALALRPGKMTEAKVAIMFTSALLAVFAFWAISIQVQIWGTQLCQ